MPFYLSLILFTIISLLPRLLPLTLAGLKEPPSPGDLQQAETSPAGEVAGGCVFIMIYLLCYDIVAQAPHTIQLIFVKSVY